MLVLRQRLKAELRHRGSEALGEPFRGHSAVTPLAGYGGFIAKQNRNPAAGEAKQCVSHEPGVETPEDLGSIKAVVLLDPDAVEPRPWCERPIATVAGRQPARRAARNADPQMIVGELSCPRRSFDKVRHGRRPFAIAISAGARLA